MSDAIGYKDGIIIWKKSVYINISSYSLSTSSFNLDPLENLPIFSGNEYYFNIVFTPNTSLPDNCFIRLKFNNI